MGHHTSRGRQVRGILLASAAVAAGLTSAPAQAHRTDCGPRRPAIERVLSDYRSAIERLDARGTERLFAADSAVFENGGVEGTYANYLAHHLGPELGHFCSFRFADHRLDLWCVESVAVATETYTYRIERTEGAPIERRGVTTSVLRRRAATGRSSTCMALRERLARRAEGAQRGETLAKPGIEASLAIDKTG